MRRTFRFQAGFRPALQRAALGLGLALAIVSQPAAAAVHAAIVVDAESGAVLYERNATRRTYPASLTKMMTLYLLFDALRRGDVEPESMFSVSRHAAAQAPTKLGLQPGERVRVRDLIGGLVTKSANDAAVVVAEGLAGTEAAFARRMTAAAHRLGMRGTRFANASGLPVDGQFTTARDMAILSLALLRDHPRRYRHFATRAFTWRGRTHRNHNHLLETFRGMDGIKTGFINASGFNLAASARRSGRRYVAVVLGGETARARDARVAALLEAAFAGRLHGGSGRSLLVAADDGGAAAGGRLVAAAASLPAGPVDPETPASQARTSRKAGRRWSIQVGAFGSRRAALRAARAAAAELPGIQRVEVVRPRGSRLYRGRLLRFSRVEARAACVRLQRHGLDCAPMLRR
jgi:D-alanyl-D-alanine carboxypeptidase